MSNIGAGVVTLMSAVVLVIISEEQRSMGRAGSRALLVFAAVAAVVLAVLGVLILMGVIDRCLPTVRLSEASAHGSSACPVVCSYASATERSRSSSERPRVNRLLPLVGIRATRVRVTGFPTRSYTACCTTRAAGPRRISE